MIGAIRIRGRWIDEQVLARLSGCAQGPDPPSRSEVVERFARAVNWRDAKGRLCISSVRVALPRLEEQGLVGLPPIKPRAADDCTARDRKLRSHHG